MARIRVLIVDDSALARALLREFIAAEADMEVVGEAANGRRAVELARELRPDIITMDLEMPGMGGLDAIEEIMCTRAVPILVVSGVADAPAALEAVGRGALEVVAKPECSAAAAEAFVARLRLLAGVPVITHLRAGRRFPGVPEGIPSLPRPAVPAALAGDAPPGSGNEAAPGADGPVFPRVFAIAASTGGPQALAAILPGLPPGFPCPVLVAQHIAEGFAAGMAEWLGSLCRLPVRLAREGEQVCPGVIYLSPSERNLSLRAGGWLALREQGPLALYHPSCDALLESVAASQGRRAVGIILTGMGHDGARGLAAIRAAGGATLAQDEASSVIYGMNRVAVEAGAVQRVLPVEGIAGAMVELGDPLAPWRLAEAGA